MKLAEYQVEKSARIAGHRVSAIGCDHEIKCYRWLVTDQNDAVVDSSTYTYATTAGALLAGMAAHPMAKSLKPKP